MSNETNLTSFRHSCLWGAIVAVDLTIVALLFLAVVVVVGILCPVINTNAKRARKSFVRRTSSSACAGQSPLGHCEVLRDNHDDNDDDDDIG